MPTTFVDDPEEFERICGYRGSWIIEIAPKREPPREDGVQRAPTVPDSLIIANWGALRRSELVALNIEICSFAMAASA